MQGLVLLTAGWASTSVAGLLALWVVRLSKVIGAGVNDNGAAEHTLRADQLDEFVGDGALCVALAVGLEVTQVTDVTGLVGWCAVVLAEWVDCERAWSARGLGEYAGRPRRTKDVQCGPAEVQPFVLSP